MAKIIDKATPVSNEEVDKYEVCRVGAALSLPSLPCFSFRSQNSQNQAYEIDPNKEQFQPKDYDCHTSSFSASRGYLIPPLTAALG